MSKCILHYEEMELPNERGLVASQSGDNSPCYYGIDARHLPAACPQRPYGDLQEFYIFGVIELPRANLMTRNDIVFMSLLVWLEVRCSAVVGLLN